MEPTGNPGLSPAVQEAIQRRMGQPQTIPQTSQVSPQAPTDNPGQPTPPSEAQAPTTPAQPQKPIDSETEIILKAMADYLKMKGKAATAGGMGGGNPYSQNPMMNSWGNTTGGSALSGRPAVKKVY